MRLVPLLLMGILVLSIFSAPLANSAGEEADLENLDTDGDGLSDAFELEYGSSPYTPDTDGDGLSDRLELFYGSDPERPDSDVDHLTDGEEVFKYGTDPTNYDTDGDGFTDYNELIGRYIIRGVERGVPSDPRTPDTDGDGLDDYYEADLTLGFASKDNPFYTNPDWDNDGIIDGEELYLYDGRCCPTAPSYNATEWPSPSPLFNTPYYLCFLSSDCDGDGLSDREELELGTLVYARDTDRDGMWDGWEVKLGTDPFNEDTDGDGLTDYEEVRSEFAYMNLTGQIPSWLPQNANEAEIWYEGKRSAFRSTSGFTSGSTLKMPWDFSYVFPRSGSMSWPQRGG